MRDATLQRVVTVIVCLAAVASSLLCFFVMIGSGLFFGDLDDGEAEAAAASSRAMGLSLVAFGGLSASVLVALLSGHIARRILRLVRGSTS